ncbi:DNA invertase [Candidatus Epulonipiscium fishelsonii]|nr:DNA invertase [Epulopiscium sp. SCG-C06WGA-EpuloA1]
MKTIINYKPKEFAELLNVSVKTLQRWDREKILIAKRNPNNRRYYTYDQYLSFKGLKNEVIRKIIIYARVSTNNQKEDLINQIKFMQTFANVKGIIVDEIIQDIGSGLNYNRKKWNKLIDEVMENKIDTIIITHKDRFIRFGFEWFERLLLKFDTKIVIINNEFLSPQEELIQDIISILQVFSCKIYGFRKYKKQIQEDNDIEKSLQNRIKING